MNRMMSGTLAHMPLSALLGVLEASNQTGRMRVRHGVHRANLFLWDGKVVYARTGNLSGTEAIDRVLEWHHGDFAYEPGVGESSVSPTATVDVPLPARGRSEGRFTTGSLSRWVVPRRDSEIRDRLSRMRSTWSANGDVSAPPVDPEFIAELHEAATEAFGPFTRQVLDEAFSALGHTRESLPQHMVGRVTMEVADAIRLPYQRSGFLRKMSAWAPPRRAA